MGVNCHKYFDRPGIILYSYSILYIAVHLFCFTFFNCHFLCANYLSLVFKNRLLPGYNPITRTFTVRRKSWLTQKVFTTAGPQWTADLPLKDVYWIWGLDTPGMTGGKKPKTAEEAGKTDSAGKESANGAASLPSVTCLETDERWEVRSENRSPDFPPSHLTPHHPNLKFHASPFFLHPSTLTRFFHCFSSQIYDTTL